MNSFEINDGMQKKQSHLASAFNKLRLRALKYFLLMEYFSISIGHLPTSLFTLFANIVFEMVRLSFRV